MVGGDTRWRSIEPPLLVSGGCKAAGPRERNIPASVSISIQMYEASSRTVEARVERRRCPPTSSDAARSCRRGMRRHLPHAMHFRHPAANDISTRNHVAASTHCLLGQSSTAEKLLVVRDLDVEADGEILPIDGPDANVVGNCQSSPAIPENLVANATCRSNGSRAFASSSGRRPEPLSRKRSGRGSR